MTLNVIAEIWNAVRDRVTISEERVELANQIVGILIDNDYNIDDMMYEFSGDRIMQKAIKFHADEIGIDELSDKDSDFDDDDSYDDDYYDDDEYDDE
jgi:hypothetical protein